MNYINAIIFGIVQGVTEFLPVSSSGHLVILHKYISLPIGNELIFDVALHLSTILAVILFFRKDVAKLFVSWIRSLAGKHDEYSKLAWLIILGTIPAGLAGYMFDDLIEQEFRSVVIVAAMLVLVGLFFIYVEKIAKKSKELNNLGLKDALIIGFAQAGALIPGTSRSGITVLAGLWLGFKRHEALRFSFLLSIPVILGAFATKIPQVIAVNLSEVNISLLSLAFASSFISAILAIKYFLQFARKHSLNVFAYYRFILAILVLALYFA